MRARARRARGPPLPARSPRARWGPRRRRDSAMAGSDRAQPCVAAISRARGLAYRSPSLELSSTSNVGALKPDVEPHRQTALRFCNLVYLWIAAWLFAAPQTGQVCRRTRTCSCYNWRGPGHCPSYPARRRLTGGTRYIRGYYGETGDSRREQFLESNCQSSTHPSTHVVRDLSSASLPCRLIPVALELRSGRRCCLLTTRGRGQGAAPRGNGSGSARCTDQGDALCCYIEFERLPLLCP